MTVSSLNGHAGGRGPVSVGTQSFGNPFIFPSGRTCRSFDELAVACQEDWAAARDLLQQGFLGAFFGGLGRADLALAAEEAKHFPDHDRGLDQLLAKLPTEVLAEPQLRIEPEALNLGTAEAGQNRELTLHLENQGMRLLYGTVTCEDTTWLALGDKPGAPRRFPVRPRNDYSGPRCRQASARNNKPLEGKLVVESNGGDFLVSVRAEVPVKPYPGSGVLAGRKVAAASWPKRPRLIPRRRRPCSRRAMSPTGTSPTAGLIRCRDHRPAAWERCSSSSRPLA